MAVRKLGSNKKRVKYWQDIDLLCLPKYCTMEYTAVVPVRSWVPVIRPKPSGSHENLSLDVLCKNCFANSDTIACIRSILLCFMSALTGIFCMSRLIRVHTSTAQLCYHHLILFYVLLAHCIVGTIEWMLGWTTQGSLACVYLRSLELLIICHFYLTLTCRVMHWPTELAARTSMIGMSLMYSYFTAFLVCGLVFAFEPWSDCYAPYWIWLSGGNVITVQLILLTFVLLCRKINAVSATEYLKTEQKRDLYSLMWAFETSVLIDLAFHVTMLIMADEEGGCSGVFKHNQLLYSSVKMPYDISTFLIPIWVVLWVFRDRDTQSVQKEEEEEDSTSITFATVVPVRRHRRRANAYPGPSRGNFGRRVRCLSLAEYFGTGLRQTRGRNPRRTLSAPSLRHTTHTAHHNTPLYSIPEEGSASSNSLQSTDGFRFSGSTTCINC